MQNIAHLARHLHSVLMMTNWTWEAYRCARLQHNPLNIGAIFTKQHLMMQYSNLHQ